MCNDLLYILTTMYAMNLNKTIISNSPRLFFFPILFPFLGVSTPAKKESQLRKSTSQKPFVRFKVIGLAVEKNDGSSGTQAVPFCKISDTKQQDSLEMVGPMTRWWQLKDFGIFTPKLGEDSYFD